MRILSWNVQYGKSAGGHFDFTRTLDHIQSLSETGGDFDVICLQEVARHMADYCRPGQEDQLQLAQQYFEDYFPVWGSGFSWPIADSGLQDDGGSRQIKGGNHLQRQEFGNLSLVKADLLDYKVHQLPQPAAPGKWQMPRVAIETCIASEMGALSIMNTHLAFHDKHETQAQIEHLSGLEQQRLAQHQSPKDPGPGCFQAGCLPSARIMCGDFNFEPESSHYQYQIECGWLDAWKHCHPTAPFPPTCGIFDTVQWPQGTHCRDYFWFSGELTAYKIKASVDTATDLSDHQPIILEINI